MKSTNVFVCIYHLYVLTLNATRNVKKRCLPKKGSRSSCCVENCVKKNWEDEIVRVRTLPQRRKPTLYRRGSYYAITSRHGCLRSVWEIGINRSWHGLPDISTIERRSRYLSNDLIDRSMANVVHEHDE